MGREVGRWTLAVSKNVDALVRMDTPDFAVTAGVPTGGPNKDLQKGGREGMGSKLLSFLALEGVDYVLYLAAPDVGMAV